VGDHVEDRRVVGIAGAFGRVVKGIGVAPCRRDVIELPTRVGSGGFGHCSGLSSPGGLGGVGDPGGPRGRVVARFVGNADALDDVGREVDGVDAASAAVEVLSASPVDQPVDHARIGRFTLVFGIGGEIETLAAFRGRHGLGERDPVAVGAPADTRDAADDAGDLPGFPAVRGHHVQLRLLAFAARAGKGEALSVGTPARFGVGTFARGESLGVARAVNRNGVDRRLVFRIGFRYRPDERDPLAVGRESRIAHLREVVVVARADRLHTWSAPGS